ncbi:hypothetical protein CC1G_14136 [Coprinopsis cinerea okayama7|uniref:DUF6533 domain-containing protein n=1 Tax=Coprinopsis cinerea (strain Okayama-7 / 130 / ATCC MYA-4618 / FGSC 9003) TaxID=240176 RepID=D6RLC1_COPC7|nr:hypothetical protein CC1G_14136 [Coprinopsis cinerea okayama7\|eukprot:XP_002911603.1 hypothetical protein CC1G_14136 [Coprinopsis cinerea okayama7\
MSGSGFQTQLHQDLNRASGARFSLLPLPRAGRVSDCNLCALSSQLLGSPPRRSGAALAAILWDWAITFGDEVELIWSKSHSSWLKWIFLFTRYYIILASIAARAVEAVMVFSDHYLSWTSLRVWYSCQVLVASHAMSALEVVLMIRGKPRWMATLFVLLLLLENGIVLVGIIAHLPKDSFHPMDLVENLPPSFSYFGFTTMAVQGVIMYLTVRRYMQGPWKTIPLVKLIFRDGTLAFTVLSISSLVMAIYTLCGLPYAVAGYPWLLVAISAVTCRMIINMQRLPLQQEHTINGSTGIQFTTFFSTVYETSQRTPFTEQLTSTDFSSPWHSTHYNYRPDL